MQLSLCLCWLKPYLLTMTSTCYNNADLIFLQPHHTPQKILAAPTFWWCYSWGAWQLWTVRQSPKRIEPSACPSQSKSLTSFSEISCLTWLWVTTCILICIFIQFQMFDFLYIDLYIFNSKCLTSCILICILSTANVWLLVYWFVFFQLQMFDFLYIDLYFYSIPNVWLLVYWFVFFQFQMFDFLYIDLYSFNCKCLTSYIMICTFFLMQMFDFLYIDLYFFNCKCLTSCILICIFSIANVWLLAP